MADLPQFDKGDIPNNPLTKENRFRPQQKGRLIPQSVTMFLNDSKIAFHGWKDLTVARSLDNLSDAFSFEVPQIFQQTNTEFKLGPGVKVTVFVNDERVISGRIDRTSISLSRDTKSVSISGRSLNADLVDCTVEGAKEYSNVPFETLVRELINPFGIKVFYSVTPKVVKKIGVKPGDTVYEVLEKAARLQGFLWVSTRAGNIRLTRAGRGRASTRILEDINLLSGSLTLDNSERFSKYTVLGQTNGSDEFGGLLASGAKGEAKDSEIKRNRPFTMIAEGNVDNDSAKDRAQWEATTRIAKAVSVDVTVQGWQQQNGQLWGLNQLVNLFSPTLGVNGDFLTTGIEYSRSDSGGTLTQLELTRLDAYDPKPVVGADGAGEKTLVEIVKFAQNNTGPNN